MIFSSQTITLHKESAATIHNAAESLSYNLLSVANIAIFHKMNISSCKIEKEAREFLFESQDSALCIGDYNNLFVPASGITTFGLNAAASSGVIVA